MDIEDFNFLSVFEVKYEFWRCSKEKTVNTEFVVAKSEKEAEQILNDYWNTRFYEAPYNIISCELYMPSVLIKELQ